MKLHVAVAWMALLYVARAGKSHCSYVHSEYAVAAFIIVQGSTVFFV